jgi:hypothetical protein
VTEKQMEALEKMFPEGFVIVYIAPNGRAHVHRNYPENRIGLKIIWDTVCALADSMAAVLDPPAKT